ncbi:MAG: tetratricopeptide repeat protein [Planctomycetota bacterium]|nr:MAG: tetratricopeptide repeat protein [Planctomycetota bacterium]
MRRAIGLLGICALAGGGCASPPPPPPGPPSEALLRARIKNDSLDPWPRYELARLYERQGRIPEALHEYGQAILLLPPRSATRPTLALGALHHRLGNLEAAARCYRDVLATIPSDTAFYRSNGDYRAAARGLKAILEAQGGAASALQALHERYLDDFGGSAEEWERPPPWLGTPSPSGGEGPVPPARETRFGGSASGSGPAKARPAPARVAAPPSSGGEAQ